MRIRRSSEDKLEIGMSSLIDCVFLLLIFFLITTVAKKENRAIDIDILFYGKERIDCDDLKVPHPLIAERDFVKIPLAEIAKPSLRAAFPDFFA